MRSLGSLLPVCLTMLCAAAFSAGTEERTGERECNFDSYKPLVMGTPIRGGHEQLATEMVIPAYPPEARRRGIGGRVSVRVLINRSGEVVRACAVGQRLLAASAESAVTQWKFQKDFGLGLVEPSRGGAEYAVLNLSFDFDLKSDANGRLDSKLNINGWTCAEGVLFAADEHGSPIWLSSEELMKRALKKVILNFPGLGHGRLQGDVLLALMIDAQGNVACAQAISGHPIAIASAMQAIQGWRFKPFVRRDRGIAVFGLLTIHYNASR